MSTLIKLASLSFLLTALSACLPSNQSGQASLSGNVPEPTPAPGVGVELNWQAPIERTNGKALDESEIESYEVSYINPQGEIIFETIDAAQRSLKTNLPEGEYTFAVRSIDTSGTAGELSSAFTCDINDDHISCI